MKDLYEYDPMTGFITGRMGIKIGYFNQSGYIEIKHGTSSIKAHRLAFELMGIEIPDGIHVDHINHDRGDNRWCNLRLVEEKENLKNKSGYQNNKSGVTGVGWCKSRKRWRASIGVDGKQLSLGIFAKFSDAVDARKNAEVLYGYHVNHGEVA